MSLPDYSVTIKSFVAKALKGLVRHIVVFIRCSIDILYHNHVVTGIISVDLI